MRNFSKVPANVFPFANEKLVERMTSWTVDFDFGKERKLNAKAAATKLLNFLFATRFLCAKLVAGKPQHGKAALGMLRVQCLQTLV